MSSPPRAPGASRTPSLALGYGACTLTLLASLGAHGEGSPLPGPPTAHGLAAFLAGALALSASQLRSSRAGRLLLLGLGVGGAAVLAAPWWLHSPLRAWLVGAAALVLLQVEPNDRAVPGPHPEAHTLLAGLGGSALLWTLALWVLDSGGAVGVVSVASLWGLVAALRWRSCLRGAEGALTSAAALSALGVAGAVVVALGPSPPETLERAVAGAVLAQGAAAAVAALGSPEARHRLLAPWRAVAAHPALLLLTTFAALAALGTLLLFAAGARSGRTPLTLLEAAFTAVSAACVTGLVVRDTGTDFGPAGQAVVLGLIQVGGLGIMTLSTAAMAAMGRRLGLRQERALLEVLGERDRAAVFDAVRRILKVTFVAEAAGAVVLSARWLAAGLPVGSALWKGLFTAVSAFCNAGFALDADSLVPFQQDPLVLHVVAALIVAGGLSPLAVVSLPGLLRGAPVPLAARLAWVAAAVLNVLGFALFASMEWNGTLAALPVADRLHNAWFQAVTLRTAGFNSVDVAAVHPATRSWMLLWMFVGGAPGGTAGGIKTTTALVVGAAAWSAMGGRERPELFGRLVGRETVGRALAVTAAALLVGFVAFVTLQLTQDLPDPVALFEVASALGTVGLTQGATARLDTVGRLVIMACMFAGRVGPLTVFYFVAERRRRAAGARPSVELQVG